MSDVRELLDEFREAARNAAILEADAKAADEDRKAVFSRLVIAAGDISVAKAEHTATAHPEYRKAILDRQRAEEKAGLARADADYLNKRFEAWRTRMSYQKAKMGYG